MTGEGLRLKPLLLHVSFLLPRLDVNHVSKSFVKSE